jgi:hypothetical protein
MKSYTDLEQSKRLAEILPIESADMFCADVFNKEEGTRSYNFHILSTWGCNTFEELKDRENKFVHFIPCWSLAALLSVIKPINENTYTIRGTLDGGATISFDEITNVMFQEEEIIDAIFEMVCWLKKDRKL